MRRFPKCGCVGCRQLVAERSLVGDELLLLAPAREPPLEFEASVLGALAGCQDVEGPSRSGGAGGGLRQPPPWSSRPRSGGGAAFLATAGDRRLAGGYRQVPGPGREPARG